MSLVKLFDRLHLRRGIYLQSSLGGEIYESFARKSPFDGKLIAYVYPFTKVGHVKLEPDGSVKNHYICRWVYMHSEPGDSPEQEEIIELERMYHQ